MNSKKRSLFVIAVVTIVSLCIAAGGNKKASENSVLNAQAVEESMFAIRPGVPRESAFWNVHARRFIYVPAFDFKAVKDAVSYRFTATSAADNKDYVFKAAKPWAALSAIWKELPVGEVVLKVEGCDEAGQVVGTAGTRNFYRAAVFKGPYNKPMMDYQRSARRALEYLFRQQYYQKWIQEGKPDLNYYLYCYPSKIVGGVIESMVMYARIEPANAEKALLIAKNAAEYLMSLSEPAGAPLEFFPITYDASFANRMNKVVPDANHGKKRATEWSGQVMLTYPASVGSIYLDLYEATKDAKYFKAATNIADTYVKLQLSCGTWPLNVDLKGGRATTENLCVPVGIIRFFDRLVNQYGLNKYQRNSESAARWMIENPLKTFNWEGQFEDVPPSMRYKNLTHSGANRFAVYLLEHAGENPGYLEQGEELLRFAEDQFVVWEKPMPQEKWRTELWLTPCVLEQYGYYVPIDASASAMIASFQKAYEQTGKELYLAKACALANAMTVAQHRNGGRYPTFWEGDSHEASALSDWANCATFDAKVMLNLGRMLAQKGQDKINR